MYNTFRSLNTDSDLESIAEYTAQDNPYRALTFVQEMMSNFERKIALFPKVGMQCTDDSYYTVYQGYYIFYDIDEHKNEVLILRAIHSAQYTEYKRFLG